MKQNMRGIAVLGAALVMAVTAGLPLQNAAAQDAGALTPDQKTEVEGVIRDYLKANPEIVYEALQELQRRQQEAQQQAQKMALTLYRNELFGMDTDPRVGAEEPGVTIIEFFDYKCGYCKSIAGNMEAIVAENSDLQVILKEFPILGDESIYAARVSLAARDHENYYEFHKAMMNARGSLNEDVVRRIAESVGMDFDELKTKMASEEIDKVINRNYQLAKALGINGTPAFVINGQLYPGVLEKDAMDELIAKARAG